MLASNQLIKITPNVALLDDDIELALDLIACLSYEVDITHFTSLGKLQKAAKEQYLQFLNCLKKLFTVIASEHCTASDVEPIFKEMISNKPYTVALIDLDLGNNDTSEGFKIGDSINQFYLKPLIYTASETSDLVMEMINQGDIYGYLNKASDLHEELLPTIHNINNQFYQYHFNMSHLNFLCATLDMDSELDINPDIEQYTVYNSNLNIVTV